MDTKQHEPGPTPLEELGRLDDRVRKLFQDSSVTTCEQAYELVNRLISSRSSMAAAVDPAMLSEVCERLQRVLPLEVQRRLREDHADWTQTRPLGVLPPRRAEGED